MDQRNPDFAVCEQQRRRRDCAYAQSDQRNCFCFLVKTMAKLGSRRVSMFQLVSVAKQARMSFTQKTGFSRRDIFPVEDAFSGQ